MKDKDGFIRDPVSGAVLNTDNAALTAYKLKKQKAKELDNLKQEVTEMKILLNKILEKLS